MLDIRRCRVAILQRNWRHGRFATTSWLSRTRPFATTLPTSSRKSRVKGPSSQSTKDAASPLPSYLLNDPTSSFTPDDLYSFGHQPASTTEPSTRSTSTTLEDRLRGSKPSSQSAENSQGVPTTPKAKLSKPRTQIRPQTPSTKQNSAASATRPFAQDVIDSIVPDAVAVPRKGKKKLAKSSPEVKRIRPRQIGNIPVEMENRLEVPKLAHNLDRVLFNPGVHVMQDPRTRVFNFDPDIATIMPVDEFDFEALGEYITSSKDTKLRELCVKYQKTYCGSTSSLSAILSHFHYLISGWRRLNFEGMSRGWEPDSTKFTNILRAPAAAFAHHHDGVYAIDADKSYDTENVLSSLGKSMEKLMILPKEEYEKYRRSRSHEIPEEQKNAEEVYHYSELGDFLVRSQLDAYDSRLPGTGVFDIKTRAVVSIRMDVQGYKKGTGYEINKLHGPWDSFEREYVDMIRAAFMKYSLQVRMGRMDGIFAAFHNTQRIFGFQYIPLSAMDLALHGTEDVRLGDEEFKASITMLNALLDRGTKRWPKQTLRLHVETRDTAIPLMYFFIQPVSDEEMQKVQSANKESGTKSAKKIVENIKGLQREMDQSATLATEVPNEENTDKSSQNDAGESLEENSEQELGPDDVWAELMTRVEDTVENDSTGLETVRAGVVNAMERHGLLGDKSKAEIEQSVNLLVEALVNSSSELKNSTGGTSSKGAENPDADSHHHMTADPETADVLETGDRDSSYPGASDTTASDEAEETRQGEGDASFVMQSDTAPFIETYSHTSADTVTPIEQDTDASAEVDPSKDAAAVAPDTLSESQDLSLKELILRAAGHIRGKSREMGSFERVFAELSAQVKSNETQEVDGVAAPSSTLASDQSSEPEHKSPRKSNDLLGMVVTVRNNVDGSWVDRPEGKFKKWDVEYSVTELPDEKAWTVYNQMKRRRSTTMQTDKQERDRQWHSMFNGELKRASRRGQRMRAELDKEQKDSEAVKVAWNENPIKPG